MADECDLCGLPAITTLDCSHHLCSDCMDLDCCPVCEDNEEIIRQYKNACNVSFICLIVAISSLVTEFVAGVSCITTQSACVAVPISFLVNLVACIIGYMALAAEPSNGHQLYMKQQRRGEG